MAGTQGRSGRKPTPTRLRLLRGNPGRRPLNQDEPQPEVALPQPPRHLSKEARREWRRTGALLQEMGLITQLDRTAFAAYCVVWARWVEAEEALKTYGMMIRGPDNLPVRSPYLQIASQALEQLRSLLSEFGMSPASRTRVTTAPVRQDDPLAEFLRGSR